MGTSPVVLDSLSAVDSAMRRLLISTLRYDSLIAARDKEIADIHSRKSPAIGKASCEMIALETQIRNYYLANQASLEVDGKKSVQLTNGLMGTRLPANPALVPLNDKWTWEKIEAKLRELWKKKYFHKPKPPGPDKVKIKKSLDEAQLKECGLKLDDAETFYLELNRLAEPDPIAYEEAA